MIKIILSLISTLPPEVSHLLTLKLLQFSKINKRISDDPILHQHLFGLDFKNPLGIAAGFDKNVEVVRPLLNLGFGFVEAGTVTPKSQYGNEKPRVFRLKEDFALINHLGFNNKGSLYAQKKLHKLNLNLFSDGVVGINIGKNKDAKNHIDDYCFCLEKLGPLAHYVTINVSSPNTPGLRELQNRGQIETLVKALQEKSRLLSELSIPIFIKISPDMNEEQIRDIALMSLANNIDGLIIGNSTVMRPSNLKSFYKHEIGGLSGNPLFLQSTLMLKKMYTLTNGQIPLIGVGGISDGITAYEKIKSGASLLQLYTALIFQGPKIISSIKKELILSLKTDGYKNIKEAVGKDI